MNILVVNGYVRENKGDAVLMSVLCRELQKTFPKATVKISSQEDPRHEPTFEDWQNVCSFNRYCFDPATGKGSHLLRLIVCSAIITALPYVPPGFRKMAVRLSPKMLRAELSALTRADLVVAMGGGYLNGNTSLMAQVAVYLMLAPLELAKRFGACAVFAPESMGPFATKFQQKLVIRTLEKADLVLTREDKTVKLLAKLSKRFPVVPSVDSGFLFTSDESVDLRAQLHVPAKDLLIGVTVRRWLDPQRQYAYERAVARTIDHLTENHHATVVFIPQVTSALGGDDDRITANRVYKRLRHKTGVHVLDEQYTHQQVKSLYDTLDLIIGTRFHSVILSLTSHVPALAIEYEHKTSGIMHDLALDKWVVKIEDATAEVLTSKINELIASKPQYKEHLKKVLPPYIAKAQEAITLIKQAYEARVGSSD